MNTSKSKVYCKYHTPSRLNAVPWDETKLSHQSGEELLILIRKTSRVCSYETPKEQWEMQIQVAKLAQHNYQIFISEASIE